MFYLLCFSFALRGRRSISARRERGRTILPAHFVVACVCSKFVTKCRCPAFSSVWLVGVNFLYFLVGMLLIGLSSWGISQQKEDDVTKGEFEGITAAACSADAGGACF